MRTTLDEESILHDLLDASSLKSEITGRIYQGGAIVDYTKENVMIKGITVNSASIQAGAANVNIHVPDLDVTIDGKDSKQPNFARLKELTDIATAVLEDYHGSDYNLYIDSINNFKDLDGIDNHYINFRIRFNFM